MELEGIVIGLKYAGDAGKICGRSVEGLGDFLKEVSTVLTMSLSEVSCRSTKVSKEVNYETGRSEWSKWQVGKPLIAVSPGLLIGLSRHLVLPSPSPFSFSEVGPSGLLLH